MVLFQGVADLLESSALFRAAQLVALGEQDMHREASRKHPVQRLLIKLGYGMSRVHDHHQPDKAGAFRKVASEELLPVAPYATRHFRVTVTGEVGEQGTGAQAKKINVPRASRRFTSERKPCTPGQGIDRRRLTRVGATCEGNLRHPL